MALTVATNTGALMAQAAASSVNKEMEISMERLATGKRINGASDDAAGVAIASRLTAEIKGTNQAIRNAMDGQALIDTAEGAHQEIETILQRMRELAVQAANDTNDANDRANLQLEIDQLTTEIDRISSTTSWAGQSLIDGTGSFSFQVGSKTTSADSISTTLNAMSSTGLGIGLGDTTTALTAGNGTSASGSTIDVQNNVIAASVSHAGKVFNTGVQSISVSHGSITVEDNVITLDFDSVADGTVATLSINGDTYTQTVDAADAAALADSAKALMDNITSNYAWAGGTATDSGDDKSALTITDDDLADDLVTLLNADSAYGGAFTASATTGTITSAANAKSPALTNASAGVSVSSNVVTVGAFSAGDTYSIDVDGTTVSVTRAASDGYVQDEGGTARALIDKANDLGLNVAMTHDDTNATITFTKGGSVDLTSGAAAQNAINAIDAAIITVNSQRATLGAVSNRLDSTVSNLTNISSNLEAGRGRIEDADFASETTSLAKSQILQQASTAMLAQANASKQNVLSLLQG